MNLGRCLEVLRTNQKLVGPKRHLRQVVPFRESKITRVLRYPLVSGGNVVMLCSIYPGRRDADETVHALRYASTAREVATTGGVADRFGAGRQLARAHAKVPRCAAGHRHRHRRTARRGGGTTTTTRTLSTLAEEPEEGQHSATSGASTRAAAANAAAAARPPPRAPSVTLPSFSSPTDTGLRHDSFLAAEVATTGGYMEQQRLIAQLRLQLESAAQAQEAAEGEIREEMSTQMDDALEEMETNFQSRLQREIAIHEEKFKFKLGILDRYATGAPCPSPGRAGAGGSPAAAGARVALLQEEVAQLHAEKAALEAQLADADARFT
jgi:hypothetical protein